MPSLPSQPKRPRVTTVPLLLRLWALHQLLSCSEVDLDPTHLLSLFSPPTVRLPISILPAGQPHLVGHPRWNVPAPLREPEHRPHHPWPDPTFKALHTLAPARPGSTGPLLQPGSTGPAPAPCPLPLPPLCSLRSFQVRWPLFLMLPTASTSLKVHFHSPLSPQKASAYTIHFCNIILHCYLCFT